MKFVISKIELTKLLNKIQNVVPVKATIPILSNFLIEAKGEELILTATDLTVGIQCSSPAKILKEGKTALPAKRFFQLIRELTAVNIEITTDERDITEIIADSSRFRLHGMSPAEYPNLPDLQGAATCKFPATSLKDVFYRTSFAVSREDNRYVLTGVLMKMEGGRAIFVGTDGKRLAKTEISLPGADDCTGNYIVPLKAVEELIKNLPDEGEATLYLFDDKIALSCDNTTLVTKLLSGDYPDFERVIPEQSTITASVPLHREELMTLLRQMVLFTPDLSDSVRFTLGGGELKLSANSSDIGEGKVSMVANYQGEQHEIAFNPTFFLDILRHCKEETINMQLTDSFNPGIITDAQEKEGGSEPVFVLMPMRLTEKVQTG